jgi:cytochrome P450
MDDYAFPLPSAVICELLGVPHSDRRAFSGWFNIFVSPSGDTGYSEVSAALTAAREYFAKLISHHRENPGTDLLSALANAAPEGRLTENELIAMALLLVIGGFETTATLIGNGALALLSNLEQCAALQADPSLVPAAVEEMLRHSGPGKVFPLRFASEELFIGGQRIRKGDRVFVLLSSANHDPTKYPDPDVFDITRDASGHLAFGHGIHRCVAAPLARIEAQIGITTLLRRLSDMRLGVPVDELEWRPGLAVHGPVTLPVRYGAVQR